MTRRLAQFGLLIAMLLPSSAGHALPIGFGYNQGAVEFSEVSSPNFVVYFDRRVPSEGSMMLEALEAARPHVERWFGAERKSPLPVILSAVSENASFANFITDALEVQTLGQGSRSLIWHEYIHQAMYRTLDNFLGPAGNIIHLPWLPAWYIEGLADTLAVSVGSDTLSGIERYQALTGEWPSYDRLHSLYSKAGFALRGYATSAAFMRYVLREVGPSQLASFSKDLKSATMPWWWPYSIVPFADSLPVDRVLKSYTGRTGLELYEEYKARAKTHWLAAPGAPSAVTTLYHPTSRTENGSPSAPLPRPLDLTGVVGIASDGSSLSGVVRHEGIPTEYTVQFDGESGWATGLTKGRSLEDRQASGARILTSDRIITTQADFAGTQDFFWIRSQGRQIRRDGFLYSMALGPSHLYWVEQQQAITRLCRLPLSAWGPRTAHDRSPKVSCLLSATMPRSLRIVGRDAHPTKSGEFTHLWLTQTEQHLDGSTFALFHLDLRTGQITKGRTPPLMEALAVAHTSEATWGLFAGRTTRLLRRFDHQSGTCFEEIVPKDHVLDLLPLSGSTGDAMAVRLYAGGRVYWRKIHPQEMQRGSCSEDPGPISPIEAAIARGGEVSLPKALEDADLWRPITPSPEKNDTRRLIPLATSQSETAGEVPQSTKDHEGRALPVVRPARWRGRPVFLLPWIGAEDIFGPQLGIVSIPLMDHLQDETVRVTALYGLASRFPYQDITLISTRFAPTLMLTYYHQQTYNGRFVYRDTNQTVSSFLEEKGGRLGADWGTRALGGILSTSAEMKVAYFQPYFGPTLRSRGWLVEPGASLALSHQLGDRMSLSNSIGARVAPPWPKHNFDYNALSASTNLNIGLPLQSSLQLGVEGSRTRGKKRRDLLEFYLPLKTFIPGSGGGYNRNSFPLMIGPKGGLFSPRFGDTEARAKANWTVPLIRDVDKLFWIIYAERLDFTAFYNYGGAWTGGEPARGWKRLVGAHGYNVDFQLENKGVRFNIGTGLGQVVSRPWEVYLTTGFDAIF